VPEDRDVTASGAGLADGDYGYDLAHEAPLEAGAAGQGSPDQPKNVHIEPATDNDGDYGYDMAHDMRAR
jgi:hypothetical protein